MPWSLTLLTQGSLIERFGGGTFTESYANCGSIVEVLVATYCHVRRANKGGGEMERTPLVRFLNLWQAKAGFVCQLWDFMGSSESVF